MAFWEHVVAGISAGILGRAIWAGGSVVGLFISQERHKLIHRHARAGHIAHFSACTEDEHCQKLSSILAAQ